MVRTLRFLAVVIIATFFMTWLTDRPGTVELHWHGYKIETSVAFLITGIVLIAILAALTYRFYLGLRHAPYHFSGIWRRRRQKKGYQALTKGMVAIAAGDADEARRQERRTQALLNEPPLTMLLSAQTAQLNGDEKAAANFFKAMTKQPDTEFLGIRGLLNQALSQNDNQRAINLAKRAYQLRPDSDWVASQLFNLQIQNGLWLDAQATNDAQMRALRVDKIIGQRRRALLDLQQGREMMAAGDYKSAAKNFKSAYDQTPNFIPSVLAHAEVLTANGKSSKATEIIEKAWRVQPHPELVLSFWKGVKGEDGLSILKATEKLVTTTCDHPESLIALARAALKAKLWGEARRHLVAATSQNSIHQEARVCRLWAELEESENQNIPESRNWLKRASLASGDPAWVCTSCGNSVSEWSILCGNCKSFDSLNWDRPRHVPPKSISEEKVS